MRLGDVLGNGEQLWHRLKRFAKIVLIEAGDDDALAAVGERAANGWQIGVEELPFVDPDDLRVRLDLRQELT
jgi:hypothetical protein